MEGSRAATRDVAFEQQIAEYRIKIEAAEAEIAAIEAAEVHEMDAVSDDSRNNKRHRS